MPSLRSFLLASCALFAACAVERPPELPVSIPSAFGRVSGMSRERVEHVVRLLDDLAPRVPGIVPECEMRRVDVRLVRELSNENWSGATYTVRARRWMELPENESDARLSATMAHELVHYMIGRDWSTLPGIVEEGLCDSVAHVLVPASAPLERARYAVMLGTALDGLYRFDAERIVGRGETAVFAPDLMTYTVRAPIDRSEVPTFEEALSYDLSDPGSTRTSGLRGLLDALGYLMVSRIGVHDLLALCRRARVQHLAQVPPTWLLEAAGLQNAGRERWLRAIDLLVGDAEKRALLRSPGLEFQGSR